jgi:hypothetical protein
MTRHTLYACFVFAVAAVGLFAQTIDVSPRRSTSVTFSSLGTPANGTQVYCSDCAAANPCTSGGSGVSARRENGVWVCSSQGAAGATGATGAAGPAGPTVYPGTGIPQSSGSAWSTSLTLDTDATFAANSDTRVPSQKSVKTKVDSLSVFYGAGTYATMTGSTAATTNAIWMMTDATTSGLCATGGGSAKAICVKNALGTWDSIVASGGTGGGSGGGTTTTFYGGFTGGGTTVNVTDADCNQADDTSAVQARLSSLANNGTLDFTGTVNTCDINAPGLSHTSAWNNVRITMSGTKGLRGIATGATSNPESALLYIENCTNCLIDKVLLDGNNKKGGFYAYSWNNSSIQNTHMHHVADGNAGPYAIIKCDNCVDIWIANNNVHDSGGVAPDVTGVRGIWCGVDVGRYCTRPTIINNTVTSTGHTGIVSEGQQVVMSNNTVSSILTQGTGLKWIPRGSPSDNIFEGNSVTNTYNGGWQYDGSGTVPLHVYVRNNTFKDISTSGCCFGAMYIANSAEKNNIQFTGNTLISGRSVANIGHATNVLLQNNTIVTPGSGGTEIAFESNVHDATVINSGTVVIQGGCSGNCTNIKQDGVIILAALPQDRSVIYALVLLDYLRSEASE